MVGGSMLEKAIKLAEFGFHVFPLIPGAKTPPGFMEGYFDKATRDKKVIKDWWIDATMNLECSFNIGISTTRFGDDGRALLAVDVDMKEGRNGMRTLLELELQGLELPETLTQLTPTGGKHLIYWTDKPVKNSVGKLGHGLDSRSYHGFLVGAGSVVEKGEYTIEGGKLCEIAKAPDWLVAKFQDAPVTSKETRVLKGVDTDVAFMRATQYALQQKQAGKWKSAKGTLNNDCFKFACALHDFGITEDEAVTLLEKYWETDKDVPTSEIVAIVKNAWNYAIDPAGIHAPETAFEPVAPEPEEKSYLDKFNDRFAFVLMGASFAILEDTFDANERPVIELRSDVTFTKLMAPHKVDVGGKIVPQTKVWMEWKQRRTYDGMLFAPREKINPRYYNMWRGFQCEPAGPLHTEAQERGLKMWKEHLLNNVANGNAEHAKWITGYFAHLIQRPFEKPLTALVLKGKKGTGKNTLVEMVGMLLGSAHYIVTANQRYLTSNFNGHLERCLLLCLDEAFWSGDKSSEGILKSLVTDPMLQIERKGYESYPAKSRLRIVVLGNEDWVVPASADERRYAVFEMGLGRQKDLKFFSEMNDLFVNKGANKALLYYLENFDLSQVDVNLAPDTEALSEQKIASLGVFEQFWFECLREGHVAGHPAFNDAWPDEISKEEFRRAFRNYTQERNIKARIPDEYRQGRLMQSLCPSVNRRQKKREGDRTIPVFKFVSLETLRAEWDKAMNAKTDWANL